MIRWVLSLDGGGIRGAASIEVLRRIEAQLGVDIYQRFDLFAGTSTGAIIAVALGVKQMAPARIAELYNVENANRIMDRSFWDEHLGLVQNQPKYDGRGKRAVLEAYLGAALLGDAEKPTLVVAYDVERRRSTVLKSFRDRQVSAVDAADASSAAPLYFPTVQVDERWLIDGGVVANNPALCAYAEARRLWPQDPIRVLSIGTGKRTRPIDGPASRGFGLREWIQNDLLGVVTDETVVEYQAATLLGADYLRINSELTHVSDEMDDCSAENIRALKALGGRWFAQAEERLAVFFGV